MIKRKGGIYFQKFNFFASDKEERSKSILFLPSVARCPVPKHRDLDSWLCVPAFQPVCTFGTIILSPINFSNIYATYTNFIKLIDISYKIITDSPKNPNFKPSDHLFPHLLDV